MSPIYADFDEMYSVATDMGEAGFRVTLQAGKAVNKAVYDTVAIAQSNAPVDTGNLKGSISGEVRGLSGEAGATAEYAPYVEDGTSIMAPQPFMGPAVATVEPQFISAIESLGGVILP